MEQRPGENHVRRPDGGGDGAGEGAQVDDALVKVLALHGGDGPGGVAELAVVIVLHQIPPLPGCPLEQAAAPGGGHGDAQGELVGGGDVGQAGAGALQGIGLHPIAVHRDGQRLPPLPPGHGVDGGIARVLQRHLAALRQQLEQEGEQIVRSGPHHNLLRRAAHPPVLGEKVGERPAQRLVPLAVAPLQKLRVLIDGLLGDARPGGEGEERGVHRAGGELIAPDPGGRLLPRRGGEGPRLGGGQRHHPGGGVAAAGPGDHVALADQHGIGGFHRAHAHPEGGAQLPLGGQALPRGDLAGLDGGGDVAVELLIEGLIAGKAGQGQAGAHKITSN